MAFKEKSAWIVLFALAWIFGGYAWSLYEAGSFGAGTSRVMIAAMVGFLVVNIAAHIVVAIFSDRGDEGEEDERDRRIEMRAERIGGFVLGACAFWGLVVALFQGEYLIANLLFLGLAASEFIKNAWQVILYRRST